MVYYGMLKCYFKMGAKVTKILRVSKFKQDYLCRDKDQYNTDKPATAKTETEKDVRKLMNPSLYERMNMNPLYFFQSKFLHDEKKIMKSISKPKFENTTKYIDNSRFENTVKK